MDLKAHYAGPMVLHLKEVETPSSLTAGQISSIQVLLELICTGAKLHGGTIMALVHILVNILEGFDGDNRLNVNMAAVLPDEILGVADHSLIVDMHTTNNASLPSVRSPGVGVTVICE